MTDESPGERFERLVRTYIEEVRNGGNYDLLREASADRTLETGGGSATAATVEQSERRRAAAFPDWETTIDDLWYVPEAEVGILHYTASGTFENEFVVERGTGEVLRFAPTGESFTYAGVTVVPMADGQVAGMFGYRNWLHWFEQLGVVPDLREFAE